MENNPGSLLFGPWEKLKRDCLYLWVVTG